MIILIMIACILLGLLLSAIVFWITALIARPLDHKLRKILGE